MDIEIDIDWDKIGRAADGMVSNHGSSALAEAERRAAAMRGQGRLTAATTWDIICKQIKARNRLQ